MAENPFTGQYSGQEVDLRKLWYMRCGMPPPNDRLVNHPPHPKYLHAGRMMPLTMENQDHGMASQKQSGQMVPMPMDMQPRQQTSVLGEKPVEGPLLPPLPAPDRLVINDKPTQQVPCVTVRREPQNGNPTFLPPGGSTLGHDQRQQLPELSQKVTQGEKSPEKQDVMPQIKEEPKMADNSETNRPSASIEAEREREDEDKTCPPVHAEKQEPVKDMQMARMSPLREKSEEDTNHKNVKRLAKSKITVNLGNKDQSKLPAKKRKKVDDKPVTQDKDRNHICRECGRAFLRTEHLRRHKKIHTGERPHICDYCDKSFTRAEHLHRHLRIHTGEKPYGCKECGKAFTRMEHLRRHLRAHAEGKIPSGKECHQEVEAVPIKKTKDKSKAGDKSASTR